MGSIIDIDENQTIKPRLVFGGTNPETGYVTNQHENNNFIKKNALNAPKFNEYERLLYIITKKIGNVGSPSSGSTIGGKLTTIENRLDSISGASEIENNILTWQQRLVGGNVYFDPIYNKDETSDFVSRGIYCDLTTYNGTNEDDEINYKHNTTTLKEAINDDYHILQMAGGVVIYGGVDNKDGIQNVTINESTSKRIRKVKSNVTDDIEMTVESGTIESYPDASHQGETHTITPSTDSIYLVHKYIKSNYFTDLSNATVVVKVDGNSNNYTDISGLTINTTTGKLGNLTSLGVSSDTTIHVYYSWYQYRRDLVVSFNSAIQVYRGQSKDKMEDLFDSSSYKFGGSDEGSQLHRDDEITFSDTFNQVTANTTLIYEVIMYPWNAMDEKGNSTFYTEVSKELNIIDQRVDISQSIVKWDGLQNGLIKQGYDIIYADQKGSGETGNKLRCNVLPCNVVIDGRLIKTKGNTFDIASATNVHKITTLFMKYDGSMTSETTSSTNDQTYPEIPSIPVGYDDYFAFIYAPANSSNYSDCYTIYNDIDHPKTINVTEELKINLSVALYNSGFYEDIYLDDVINDTSITVVHQVTDEYVNGSFGEKERYIPPARLNELIPAIYATISDFPTHVISSYGIGAEAPGKHSTATGKYARAEGQNTTASGDYSHAEGNSTEASGIDSHAEGYNTTASGYYSHAEGDNTTASGPDSHAEGYDTEASGSYSHAEGNISTASGWQSHAEGYDTEASGPFSHAEGYDTEASGSYSHAEGNISTASGSHSHAEGSNTKANGNHSHAEGNETECTGIDSHSGGEKTLASGAQSFAHGLSTNDPGSGTPGINALEAGGIAAHAEGKDTYAAGYSSHAEGGDTIASGGYSHAEGYDTTASGSQSHAEGYISTASGINSHAEGHNSTASSWQSHAEGYNTEASGSRSHSEGEITKASGNNSHTEGKNTIASGNNSHAQGRYTTAEHQDSSTMGNYAKTWNYNQMAHGGYFEGAGGNQGDAQYSRIVLAGYIDGSLNDKHVLFDIDLELDRLFYIDATLNVYTYIDYKDWSLYRVFRTHLVRGKFSHGMTDSDVAFYNAENSDLHHILGEYIEDPGKLKAKVWIKNGHLLNDVDIQFNWTLNAKITEIKLSDTFLNGGNI